MRKGFISILLIAFALLATAQVRGGVSEREVFKAIRQGDFQTVKAFLSSGKDIDANYSPENMTLLNYAIRKGETGIVQKLLDEGANPDKDSQGKTPLMYSIQERDTDIARMLISSGAHVDLRARKGNTALMFAARTGKTDFVELLIENGARARLENDNGFTALDLANAANYPGVATYLVKIIEMRNYYKDAPHYTDGPYIEWIDDHQVKMFYMQFDTLRHYPVLKEKFYNIHQDTTTINSFMYPGKSYTVVRDISPDPAVYSNVDKILAIGDIHGHYASLVNYLRNNGVIDDSLNWVWGSGHVVMLGDVFDRGNQVTETLWFLYQLDLSARRSGGRVHLLLGNHEVMAMTNDTRYLNRKYEMFSNYFMKDYALFFDENSLLGRWLRARNTIIKINDLIFSHAGISPVVLERHLSLARINQVLRQYLVVDPVVPKTISELTALILNAYGPLWYRGYIYEGADMEMITQQQVEKILNYYHASRLVIAHSEVKSVRTIYNGKVIAIDIPIRMKNAVPEALLVDNGRFYRLQSNGSLVHLDDRN